MSFRARSAVKLGADNDDELPMPRASKVVEGEALCELAKRLELCRKLVLADWLILAQNQRRLSNRRRAALIRRCRRFVTECLLERYEFGEFGVK